MKSSVLSCLLAVLSCGVLARVHASEGDPVALITTPQGIVIESHWGHRIALVPDTKTAKSIDGAEVLALDKSIAQTLTRMPNEEAASWQSEPKAGDANSIQVKIDPSTAGSFCVTTLDGLSIGVVVGSPKLTESGALDALVVLSSPTSIDSAMLLAMVEATEPRMVLLPPGKPGMELGTALADLLKTKVEPQDHNTVALSANDTTESGRVLHASVQPWVMPDDLAARFEAMEASCARSQKVFAALSVEQLNFSPANGTHTPRWNAEHMMGRQLLFFSQIYNKVDSTIPIMDLNPAQMPPDYRFAHPTWDGQEEARQMQRVSDFTRRYAYLLEGLPLNKKPPATFWPTLDALLKQMERHYDEHTANTQKKFELEGWPKS